MVIAFIGRLVQMCCKLGFYLRLSQLKMDLKRIDPIKGANEILLLGDC